MKRYLIEITQDVLIQCDNTECDYAVKNESGDPNIDVKGYIDKPCPLCGENLLTEKDYLESEKMLKIVNWFNKWFSWLTIFIPRKEEKTLEVHVHDGIKISKRS